MRLRSPFKPRPPTPSPRTLVLNEVRDAYLAHSTPRPPDEEIAPSVGWVTVIVVSHTPLDIKTTYYSGHVTAEVGLSGQLVVTTWRGRRAYQEDDHHRAIVVMHTPWSDPIAVPGAKWVSRDIDEVLSIQVYAPGEWKGYRIDQ